MGLKFVAELIIVRYLATEAYGAWTYALSAVLFLRGFSTLGLNRAISRFVPIHMERREQRKFFGVVALVLGCLTLAGAAVTITFYAFPEWVARAAGGGEDQPIELLFIMVFLVPVELIDGFLTEICAAFSASRTMFVRRYLLSPGLRITVALTMVLAGAEVTLLAYGYLLSALVGVAYYAWSVQAKLRAAGLLEGGLPIDLRLPVRKVFSYTVPVMASDWCVVLMSTAGPLLLGYFSDMSTVALFQVVIPLVTLNRVVSQSFGVLFEPAASRLYARGDASGLERLYWRAAAWVAILGFPGFAVTFVAAEPLTTLLFGQRYAAAAPILSVLALGAFLDAILGFNAGTLRVAGRLRWLIGVNVVAAATNVGLNLILIPTMGALGAAIATGTSWALHGILKQVALHVSVGIPGLHPDYAAVHGVIAAAIGGLVVIRLVWPGNLAAIALGVTVTGVAVLLYGRSVLSISETFPELTRWRTVERLLG